jgi:hypothetical protein
MSALTNHTVKWSHSSLKDFDTCPRKYYETRVLKKWPREEGPEALFGTALHKAAELYIKEQQPLAPEFRFMQPVLDVLCSKSGDKYCEHEMALTYALVPCAMDAPDVWVRSIADLLVVDQPNYTAWLLDYKTGKHKYADTSQLDLMALQVFAHFPKIKRVKGALLFVMNGGHIVKHEVDRESRHGKWWDYRQRVAYIEQAMENGVWNPKKSGLCRKHCEVLSCEFNERG